MSAQAMMRVKYKRPRGFNNLGHEAAEEVRRFVVARLTMGLTDMQKSILETPVYTGRTLVNFRWSVGSPIMATRAAISQPSRPGKTSDLPLGSEPRRRVNAERIQQEFMEVLAEIKSNPYQSIYLTNNLEHFSDVEYGTYAHVAGKKNRTPPGGMTRRGETLLSYSLMGMGTRVEGN